jgi:coiled-coil domain-containing protein 130
MSTLAAARADNFYFPKDWDPSKGSLTTFYKTKKSGGKPPKFSGVKDPSTIRFEMMFNVRCQGCGNSIGKGVRFNAKKKHVDTYLSTKIYEFSMPCHLCSHRFVIRTDPKNCDYLLVSGLDKRVSNLKLMLISLL